MDRNLLYVLPYIFQDLSLYVECAKLNTRIYKIYLQDHSYMNIKNILI